MSVTTETAKETKGAALSMADVAKVSELKDLGWSVNGSGKEWTAFEKAGELRKVGPASSINLLRGRWRVS